METTIVQDGYIGDILGLYGDNGKQNGNFYRYNMVIQGIYWDYMGIMENKMETSIGIIWLYRGYIGIILG